MNHFRLGLVIGNVMMFIVIIGTFLWYRKVNPTFMNNIKPIYVEKKLYSLAENYPILDKSAPIILYPNTVLLFSNNSPDITYTGIIAVAPRP